MSHEREILFLYAPPPPTRLARNGDFSHRRESGLDYLNLDGGSFSAPPVDRRRRATAALFLAAEVALKRRRSAAVTSTLREISTRKAVFFGGTGITLRKSAQFVRRCCCCSSGMAISSSPPPFTSCPDLCGQEAPSRHREQRSPWSLASLDWELLLFRQSQG